MNPKGAEWVRRAITADWGVRVDSKGLRFPEWYGSSPRPTGFRRLAQPSPSRRYAFLRLQSNNRISTLPDGLSILSAEVK